MEMSDASESVLHRKLGLRRVGRSPIPDIDLIGEYFGLRLEDRLRPLLGTIVGSLIMDCTITKLSTVVEEIPVPAMLGLIAVESSDNSALANLSTELVYHIVDIRMGGDPATAPMTTTRSFTAIDVALCMDVFECILTSFRLAIEESTGVPLNEKLRVAGHKQDVNTVRIAPKTADVLLLKVSLDIGEAARSGDFDLIIPLSLLDQFRASTQLVETEEVVSPTDLWRRQMRLSVSEASMPLHGILHTHSMSLAEVKNLEPGLVIPVPADAINQIGLVLDLGTEYMTQVTTARLGSHENKKVVKLNDGLSEEVAHTLAKAIKSG